MKSKFEITIKYIKEFDSEWYDLDKNDIEVLNNEYDNNIEVLVDDIINNECEVLIKELEDDKL